jgi:hypothetical protein
MFFSSQHAGSNDPQGELHTPNILYLQYGEIRGEFMYESTLYPSVKESLSPDVRRVDQIAFPFVQSQLIKILKLFCRLMAPPVVKVAFPILDSMFVDWK